MCVRGNSKLYNTGKGKGSVGLDRGREGVLILLCNSLGLLACTLYVLIVHFTELQLS